MVSEMTAEPEHRILHGRRVAYRRLGRGPLLLLIHGIASSSQTWEAVAPRLAARHTVLAVDLPGHGGSSGGAGDYSLGSLASTVRDLMVALGHRRATLAGHSLGGGVAMQVAYQFPELCERLVLESSGGLGVEVSPVLRALSLPGAQHLVRLGYPAPVLDRLVRAGTRIAESGVRAPAAAHEYWRSYYSLRDGGLGPPSWTRCGRWSAPVASGSAPPTGSAWPPGCRS